MPAGAASAAAGDATVRVAHLSPDAPSVDVHVNGAKTLPGVLYNTVSKYLSVPPGQYRFEVARPAGADAGSKAVTGRRPRRIPRRTPAGRPPDDPAVRRC